MGGMALNSDMVIHASDTSRYGAFSFGTERDYVPENFGDLSPTLFRQLAVRGTAMVKYIF